MNGVRTCLSLILMAAGLIIPTAAQADLKLSQLIVELQQGNKTRDDIEVWNDGPERAFIAVEPREIIHPGTSVQTDRRDPDPEKLGLLVSPARLILEPGQRRLLRVAALTPSAQQERVYRVTVKPVAGELKASASGIKVLVGYDVLVLVRPSAPSIGVSASREGGELILRNGGNASVELVDGQQCNVQKQCSPLGGKRLYAGASWTIHLLPGRSAEFMVKGPGKEERRVF